MTDKEFKNLLNKAGYFNTRDIEKLLKEYNSEKAKGKPFGLGAINQIKEAKAELRELKEAADDANNSLGFNNLEEATKKVKELKKAAAEAEKEAKEAFEKLIDGLSDEDKRDVKKIINNRTLTLDEKKTQLEALKNRNILDGAKLDDFNQKYEDAVTKATELSETEERVGDTISKNTALVREQNRQRDEGLRKMKEGLDKINKTMKEFSDAWAKVDVAASKFSKNIGIGAAGMDSIRKNSIESVAKGAFGVKYNVSADELIGIRENFASTIGRNVTVNGGDMENMAAMSAVMKENANEMANRFENFGLSYTDAAEHAGKMFKQAGAAGISFNKYADNVVKNLSMAQNYTFRNGIRGLESMAKKATAIRLDMNQIANFASKVENIEGAVTTGAQLQVLGGPFAMMSDPLGMLNEGLNDVEGLMDRFTKMVGGLGRFNATTGEIAVSSFNKQRVKAAASAMGMDYGQVMESIQAQGRQNYIGQQISGKGYSSEDIELLKNIATVRNGAATVSWTNSKGELKSKDLSTDTLTADDLTELRKVNQSESDNIKDIAQQLRSWDDYITGAKKQVENKRAQFTEKSGIMGGLKKLMGDFFGNNTFVGTYVAVTSGFKVVSGLLTSILGATLYGNYLKSSGMGTNFLQSLKGGFGSWGGASGAAGGAGGGIGALLKSPVGKFLGTSLGIGGAALGIGGYLNHKDQERRRENGDLVKGSEEDKQLTKKNSLMMGIGGGAAAGAAIGSFIPVIGTALGAIIGGALGWAGGAIGGNIAANKNGREYALNQAANGGRQPETRAKGGLLNGPSHAKGGMPILGSNIEVEGGEYVINKKATAKNLGLLSAINNNQSVKARNGGKLVNTSDSPIRPRKMENGGVIVKETKSSQNINNVSAGTLSIPPIDINLNGKITLEGANGRGIDITDELLNDKPFIRKLTKMIEEQIIQNTKGGNVVQKGLY